MPEQISVRLSERLVEKDLLDHGLPLHIDEHAHKAGVSLETALHGPLTTIHGHLDAKEYAMGGLMDIKVVFNYI